MMHGNLTVPPLDADLGGMSAAQLLEHAIAMRAAIRKHRDSSGHDLCWHHPELWDLLPDKTDKKPEVPPMDEFMQKCASYRMSLENPVASFNKLLQESHGRCCICQGTPAIIDFIIPLAKGGEKSEENMIPVCSKCSQGIHLENGKTRAFGTPFTERELREHKKNWLEIAGVAMRASRR